MKRLSTSDVSPIVGPLLALLSLSQVSDLYESSSCFDIRGNDGWNRSILLSLIIDEFSVRDEKAFDRWIGPEGRGGRVSPAAFFLSKPFKPAR